MDLSERISTYIFNNAPVTYTKIVEKAQGAGFTELEVLQALNKVHRNRALSRKVLKGEVVYDLTPIEVKKPDHSNWLKANYPYPGQNGIPPFVMPFPDWSLSWMFLTPEELVEYKEAVRGGRVYKRKRYQYANTR